MRKLLVAAVLVMSALGLTTSAAGAAEPAGSTGATGITAATAWDCPTDAVGCLYKHAHGQGDRFVVRKCGSYMLPYGWRDVVSSARSMNGTMVIWNQRAGQTSEKVARVQLGEFHRQLHPNDTADYMNVIAKHAFRCPN